MDPQQLLSLTFDEIVNSLIFTGKGAKNTEEQKIHSYFQLGALRVRGEFQKSLPAGFLRTHQVCYGMVMILTTTACFAIFRLQPTET
jgi:hypothetical protein